MKIDRLRILAIILTLFVSGLLLSAAFIFAQEEGAEGEAEEWYTPFYYPFTSESENWFQPFYHPYHPETRSWFRPFVALRGEYDDNIYLAREDEKSDWITTIIPGFVFEPQTNKHKLIVDYRANLNFFADYDEETNYNHVVDAATELNFNRTHINLTNMFRYFSDRASSEDTNRVDRTQNYSEGSLTFDFNKLDLSLGYNYHREAYRTDDAIGTYKSIPLTYKDLERDEYGGAIEAGLKLWPKTTLLFSGHYGIIDHDTGRKSDSDYIDALVGLHGQPTAKCTVEGKIGFRSQDFEDDEDFESVVFNGSIIERFTAKDALRFDFLRTTNDTVYQENAYYESTFLGLDWQHNLTERVIGNAGFSYQYNYYPTETTLDGLVQHREDDFWSAGLGLRYMLPRNYVVDLKYQYRMRDSNYSRYDYKNNRISAGLTARF